MKNILLFESFINEGMKSESVINMMMQIILERINISTIESNYKERYKKKPTIEYTYKTFFNSYKNDDFIKQMFIFFKSENRNPKIIFRFERKFSYYEYQTDNVDPNGFYNPETSDIQINIWNTKLDLKQIKQTLSHELRHLYDDVVRNAVNYDNEDKIEYKNKPSEVRARITGFINSYENWDKDINDIIKDAESALRSENYDRKKLLKLIYQLKKTGLDKHTIIPTKKFEGRKNDIDSFVKEAEANDIHVYYEPKHRIITINNSLLSVNSIDEITGDLGYPLLEMLLDIYDKKNINIVISNNNLALVLLLKEKYNRDVIKIRQKEHWSNRNSLAIKYLLSKNGKIPNYEKLSDVEELNYDSLIDKFYNTYRTPMNDNLEKFIKDLGLTEQNMIACLQKIIDKGKYFYMYENFYLKWEDRLDFSKSDIHYFEIKNNQNDEITKFYLVNAEKDKTILMDRIEKSLNYKKIK